MIASWTSGSATVVLGLSLAASACGDDGGGGRGGAGTGGAGGTGVGGTGSGSLNVGSGGSCPGAEENAGPDHDIVFDATSYFGGPHAIEGTIELPSGTAGCLYGQFQITKTNPYQGTTGFNPTTSRENPLRFRAEGLPDGEYLILLRLDTDGDFDMDLEGNHGGTVEAPIQDHDLSVPVIVSGGDVTGVEFGIGPY